MKIRSLAGIMRQADAHNLDRIVSFCEVWSHADQVGEFYTLVARTPWQSQKEKGKGVGAVKLKDATATHVGWVKCRIDGEPTFIPWDVEIGEQQCQ